VQLALDAPESGVSAKADPLLVTELLSNLIDNAIRYHHRGGQVVVTVSTTDAGALIKVEDDGPGIPDANRQAVFQRFYRLPRDQQRAGSGLGLSIVQAIAARLGGSLSLGAGLGGAGLSVAVALPPD
jgi:two-component system sensor histidine kinase TctE